MRSPLGYFNQFAITLADNGYSVIPLRGKKPFTGKWTTGSYEPTKLEWLRKVVRENRYEGCNIGIVTGYSAFAVDIDEEDPDRAERLKALAFQFLGETQFVRFGRRPRMLLLYRPGDHIDSCKFGCIEILSFGRQFVAYGIHPDSGGRYEWQTKEHNPATAPRDRLPVASGSDVAAFVNAVSRVLGGPVRAHSLESHPSAPASQKAAQEPPKPVLARSKLEDKVKRNRDGLVVDGREAFLTKLVAAAYARGEFRSPTDLALDAWQKFAMQADLSRPKGSNPRSKWTLADAERKARNICRRAPALKRPVRRSRGGHAASHLNTFRRSEYWTVERRQGHLNEVVRRVTPPFVIRVARAMIQAVDTSTGFCTKSAGELAEDADCSVSAVKKAQRKLVDAKLWLRAHGVYVPIPNHHQGVELVEKNRPEVDKQSTGPDAAQVPDQAEKEANVVHQRGDPLYRIDMNSNPEQTYLQRPPQQRNPIAPEYSVKAGQTEGRRQPAADTIEATESRRNQTRASQEQTPNAVLQAWLEGFAKLDHARIPSRIPKVVWLQFIGDGARFLALEEKTGACSAALLGWGELDLFGIDQQMALANGQKLGLLWFVRGGKIVELDAGAAVIEDTHSTRRNYIRRKFGPGAVVLPWEL